MSKEMISKELLSLILDRKDIKEVDSEFIPFDNEIAVVMQDEEILHYNLDTLGRLCKEWCHKHGYYISSMITKGGKGFAESDIFFCHQIDSFEEDIELEAIIKATKWVAKEKGLLV